MAQTINIITRTSNRPNFFSECYRSVSNQENAGEVVHWCTSDDDETYKYLESYANIRLVQIVRPRRKNKQHFPYNKYLHEVMNIIDNDGWVLILDDDDTFHNNTALARLRKVMEEHHYNDQEFFIWKTQTQNGRTIPSSKTFENKKIDPDEVTDNCFCFHIKHKDLITFDSRLNAEFNVLTTLANCLKAVWIDEVITEINNTDPNGGQGNRLDKTVSKPKIGMKSKIKPMREQELKKEVVTEAVSPTSETLELIPIDQISQYSDDSVSTNSTTVFTPTKVQDENEVDEGEAIEINILDKHQMQTEQMIKKPIIDTKKKSQGQKAQGTVHKESNEEHKVEHNEENESNNAKVEETREQVSESKEAAVEPESSEQVAKKESDSDEQVVESEEQIIEPENVIKPNEKLSSGIRHSTEQVEPSPKLTSKLNPSQSQSPSPQLEKESELKTFINSLIKESLQLREQGSEMTQLIKELQETNKRMRQCIDSYRSLKTTHQTEEYVDMHHTSQTKRTEESKPILAEPSNIQTKTVTIGKARVMNPSGKAYEIIDDSSSGEQDLPGNQHGLLDHLYILQSSKNDKYIEQILQGMSQHAIGHDLIDLGPKTRFNQVLKTVLNDSTQKGYKKIAIIYGNEVTLHSKFYDLLERHLSEVNPEFGLLFMCHKLSQQSKEWSRQEVDYKDYLFLYDDMKNKSEKEVASHWKAYGPKEYRIPKISVELAKSNIDNRWGVIINHTAISPLLHMLNTMPPNQLLGDSILIEYQRKYGHSFYCLPNILIPRQPNGPRLKKICQSNGWFHHFFENKIPA